MIASAVLLATIAAQVVADDKIEKITILGHDTDLIGSAISASEGFVGEAEISVRPLLRTGELMELVPGMVATQHSGSGKANQYFLRGFNLDHGTDFATFVDGMPVNMRTHGHGQGYTDINFIIPELVANMAYKKGPYYAETGDFSGAGSAFFNTQSRLEQGFAQITLGEDQYQRLLLANSQAKVLGGELLYAIEQQSYAGPWTDIDEDVDKINVLVKHSQQRWGGELSITAMAYDNSWNSADQIPQRAVDSGLIDQLGSIDPSLGGDSSRYSLSANWDSQQGSLSVYAIDYDLDLFSNFTYFLDDPVNGDQFEQVDNRRIYGASGHWHIDAQSMRTTLGFETRYDDIGEVGLYKSTDKQRRGAVRSDQVDELSWALYAKNERDWSNNFRTSVGLRYDYYDFDVTSRIDHNINDVDLSANNGQRDANLLSVKGSATYKLSDTAEVYIAAGQGFHSNDARGTTSVVDPNDGSQIDPVDPLVKSHGAELGMRFNVGSSFNSSISLWTLSLDSELLFVGDAGNTEASRPSKRKGIELTSYYRINDIWTLDLEYTVTDSEFTNYSEDGDKVPGAINQVLQLGASAVFENGWFASARLRHFGERPLLENDQIKSEPSSIVNAQFGKNWGAFGLKLELLNLFDRKDHDIDYFYASRLPGEPADGIEDNHFHPIEPRTIRLTAQYHF
ncbi:TonB-dependent receptor [Neptunicella sp. SCSIO 80796]|uniref:TonB-dependent receptor n=1 Tax=Neptunicella plasticusilytica TaxID=3117012 RepID=UPI003A4D559B